MYLITTILGMLGIIILSCIAIILICFTVLSVSLSAVTIKDLIIERIKRKRHKK